MTAVTLALGLYIALDMKHDDELQARATKTTATVIERDGTPYKSEYLNVKLDGASTPENAAAPEVKISKYLSHPNWEAAKPGSKVDVLYDAHSKQAWLAADLLRWQKDKKPSGSFRRFYWLWRLLVCCGCGAMKSAFTATATST